MLKAPLKTSYWSSTVGEVLISLHELFKEKYGLDVHIRVHVHRWPSTQTMARLAIKDMTYGDFWDISSQSRQTFLHISEKMRKKNPDPQLHTYSMDGKKGTYGNLSVAIFQDDLDVITKLKPLPKLAKKTSEVASVIRRLEVLFRERYNVEANITVNAFIRQPYSIYFRDMNDGMTSERVHEILNDIAIGTKWKVHELKERSSESYGKHHIHLKDPAGAIDFTIFRDMPKEELEQLEIKNDRHPKG